MTFIPFIYLYQLRTSNHKNPHIKRHLNTVYSTIAALINVNIGVTSIQCSNTDVLDELGVIECTRMYMN